MQTTYVRSELSPLVAETYVREPLTGGSSNADTERYGPTDKSIMTSCYAEDGVPGNSLNSVTDSSESTRDSRNVSN